MATLITKNSSTASAVPAVGDLVKGELAVNVTDKKVYTKDNSAAVVKLVGSLGNQEANAVAVTGGTINGTTIGATTPSTGAFTTASASSGFTGNLTGNVTGNVSGTAANVTGVVAIANGGTGLSALGTGVQSALGQAVTGSGSFVLSTSPSLTTPNLGTPSAAVLTNATGLPLTTGVTGTLGVANGGTGITAFGTGVATALGQNVTGSGGIVLATSPSLTTPNLGTPSAATLTNATGLPISTGVSGLGTGVATALGVAVGSAGAFVVNGGALGTPSSGTVTNLTGTASININGTVGATTPTTGAFTTLSASGNITVSGGTANGVAYLNGSKVLTTGSALTFDGTTFKASIGLTVTNSGANGFEVIPTFSAGAETRLNSYNRTSSAYTNIGTDALAHYWLASGSEQMRLTSTGLGIGTSSPSYKLDVQSGTTAVQIRSTTTSAGAIPKLLFNHAGNDTYSIVGGSYMAWLSSDTTERMRLDSSGNLGLGVTPSAWGSGRRAIALGASKAALSTQTGFGDAVVSTNAFHNGTNWIYEFSSVGATRYDLYNGQHAWFTAASGTAGNTISFTQAMTLDASGNLGVGSTSPYAPGGASQKSIEIAGTSYGTLYTAASSRTVIGLLSAENPDSTVKVGAVTNNPLAFLTNSTERARITSGGDFLVGTTGNDGRFRVEVGATNWARTTNHTNGGTQYFDSFRYNGTEIGKITGNNTATAYNTSSDYRLKNIEGPLTGSGAFIDALKPKVGTWKADGSKFVGFLAHEVQEVSPSSVVGTKDAVDEEGKPIMQAMEYGSAEFIANIIAELQSLRARVAQLEAK